MSDVVEIPRSLCGPLAALIRWALPRIRVDWGGPMPWERELRALEQRLSAAALGASCPQPDTNPGPVWQGGDAMVTTAEAANALGKTSRSVRRDCDGGRISGAKKIAGTWFVPLGWLESRIDEMKDTP